jgi:two-component system, OmpR family, response regulator VanR
MDAKKKILIVEDDVNIRNFYAEFLSDQYLVESAGDGEEGFAKALSGKFDLILLDLMMPKLDGVGFLQRKKQTPELLSIPVVVMTNLGQDEILKKCFDLGVKYYVLKANTTPDKVLPVLSKALGAVDKNKAKE